MPLLMQVRLLAGQRAGRLDIAQQLSDQRAHVLAQGFNMTILSKTTTMGALTGTLYYIREVLKKA